ncbi:MAG: T9SS type A sorting domain-containing protein [Phycisphaeraceae bacterium]|nr:T9SS type A sorting domain-containing protein [Phycisphaeraceae bacterium]
MKKNIQILTIVFFAFITGLHAQWTSTTYNDELFRDVHFAGSTGYAVGAKNIIYKSTDGGGAWSRIMGPLTNNDEFNAVFFRNPNLGWVGGANGLLLRTTDGGVTWDTLNLHLTSAESVKDITFVSDTVGYVVGPSNVIYKTTDGGDSLKKVIVTEGFSTFMFFNVCFPSDLIGYAASTIGRTYKSTDGGETWNKITNIASSTGLSAWDGIGGMDFTDNTTGYIVTYSNGVAKTTDGGVTWSKQNLPGNKTTSDISCGDATNCWITTGSDSLYFTANGNTWSGYKCSTLNPGTAGLEGVFMIDAATGFVVGSSLFQAVILKMGIVSSSGEDDLNSGSENIVYPNPVNSEIHVTVNKNDIGSIATVYNQLGEIVLTAQIVNEQMTILLPELSTGLYFFRINNDNGQQGIKFIKK